MAEVTVVAGEADLVGVGVDSKVVDVDEEDSVAAVGADEEGVADLEGWTTKPFRWWWWMET